MKSFIRETEVLYNFKKSNIKLNKKEFSFKVVSKKYNFKVEFNNIIKEYSFKRLLAVLRGFKFKGIRIYLVLLKRFKRLIIEYFYQ